MLSFTVWEGFSLIENARKMKDASKQRLSIRAERFLRVVLLILGSINLGMTSRAETSTTYLQCPPQCSCLGNVIDCSKRSLAGIPNSLPTWVENLDLCSNSIKSISAEEFENLDRLSEINLSDNPLEDVSCNAFIQLPQLKKVGLAHCRLTKLPRCDATSNITYISLNHNDIGSLDSRFLASFPELSFLDLGYNRISQLNGSLFLFLPQLLHLFLNNNNLAVISRGVFDNLVSLEWLKLSKNRIQSLQKNTFLHLGQLKHLELERNRLHVIEGLVFNGLDNLVTLKLKRNAIGELMDGAFWRLSRIELLDLSHNNISSVSNKWLYGLESLLQLSVAYNQISQIEEDSWKFCQNLVELDLSYNFLSSLSDRTFEKLDSLQALYIRHNRLSVVVDGSFAALSSLRTLNLSFNEISLGIEDRSGPFNRLTSLNRLDLQHNRIRTIQKQNFQGLTKLHVLQLNDNNISSIQANAFETLTELREFHLNSSKFFCDCQLSWLRHWVNEVGVQSTVSAQCESPESLRDRNVLDLASTDFKCVNFPKPVITREPESQTVIKYENMTLTCQAVATASSPLTIEWKKDNVVVADSDTTIVDTNDDMIQVTSLIQIWTVQDFHAGSYQCIASNALGTTYSNKVTVTVSVFPTFLKTPSNVVVKSGTTARLDCAANGSPQPEISLQKDGGDDFPAARERRMHIYPSDEMFFIVDIKTEDQGLYTCIAKNDVGIITANASLQVLESPSFVKQMENKRTLDGETTVLECMTSGSPRPRLEWLKDGTPLQLTLRHFFTADDQLLVIVQTQVSDAGDYTCVVTNTLGSERQTSRLTVVLGAGVAPSSVEDTTTGIIVIAVVCCVVGTSLVWVIVIYKTRQRRKDFVSRRELADKGLAAAFRGRACYDESLPVQGLYCPIQISAFSGSDINGMKCQQHRHSSLYPSDTEDEEDDKERYLYCHSHHHDTHLPDDQVCRQRTDSGTHTASSSLSSCMSSSRTGTEPLQKFRSFGCPNPQTPNSEMADTGQILAVIHLQSNLLSSHHDEHKHSSSSSLHSTNASQNMENSSQGEVAAQCSTPLLSTTNDTSRAHASDMLSTQWQETSATTKLHDVSPGLGTDPRSKNCNATPTPGTAPPMESIKETLKEPSRHIASDCDRLSSLDYITTEVKS